PGMVQGVADIIPLPLDTPGQGMADIIKPPPATPGQGMTDIIKRPPGTPVIVAGSTHPGEEEIICSVFKELKKKFPSLVIIVAPRNTKRAREVENIFRASSFKVCRSGDIEAHTDLPPSQDADVVVIDRMGILAGLYRGCDIAFIGGSLLPFGGHNPLEPAFFGKPVVFGIDMSDFQEIAETMISHRAAYQVPDQRALLDVFTRLLNDSSLALEMGGNGKDICDSGKGALRRVINLLEKA
ncbi:MAG: hypothetical protein HQK66_15480, partial [Desulfamplus sp.]|nr:hypothetical protein [Desulfamplus sp.]